MCYTDVLKVGLGDVALEYLPSTSEIASWNLGPGTSCWKVGSYLQMPGGLQCRILTY